MPCKTPCIRLGRFLIFGLHYTMVQQKFSALLHLSTLLSLVFADNPGTCNQDDGAYITTSAGENMDFLLSVIRSLFRGANHDLGT